MVERCLARPRRDQLRIALLYAGIAGLLSMPGRTMHHVEKTLKTGPGLIAVLGLAYLRLWALPALEPTNLTCDKVVYGVTCCHFRRGGNKAVSALIQAF